MFTLFSNYSGLFSLCQNNVPDYFKIAEYLEKENAIKYLQFINPEGFSVPTYCAAKRDGHLIRFLCRFKSFRDMAGTVDKRGYNTVLTAIESKNHSTLTALLKYTEFQRELYQTTGNNDTCFHLVTYPKSILNILLDVPGLSKNLINEKNNQGLTPLDTCSKETIDKLSVLCNLPEIETSIINRKWDVDVYYGGRIIGILLNCPHSIQFRNYKKFQGVKTVQAIELYIAQQMATRFFVFANLPERPKTENKHLKRFCKIADNLPPELQMILCNRIMRLSTDVIDSVLIKREIRWFLN